MRIHNISNLYNGLAVDRAGLGRVEAGIDGAPWPWHSHRMHRRAAPRHFLIVFALAHVLAIHGLLTAWGTGISAYAGDPGVVAIFCINSQAGGLQGPNGPADRVPHHSCDCAMACAAVGGLAPALTGGVLVVSPNGTGVVMTALGEDPQPTRFSGVVQARGPPQTA